MKERPLICTGESVRAILARRKWQTRRLLKADAKTLAILGAHGPDWSFRSGETGHGGASRTINGGVFSVPLRFPYGAVGDRLWIREVFCVRPIGRQEVYEGRLSRLRCYGGGGPPTKFSCRFMGEDMMVQYKENPKTPEELAMNPGFDTWSPWMPSRWRSPIYMPRWASRLTLEITEVRVQRLQEISEEDAKAEGVYPLTGEYREGFSVVWNEINFKRASWASNPWVWAVTFWVVS